MNEAFMNQITAMLASAQSAATTAGLAVRAEVPELCRQIVAWELWSNVAYGLVWLCVLIPMAAASIKAAKWLVSEKPPVNYGTSEYYRREYKETFSVITLVASGITLMLAACSFLINILPAIIKCLTAPNLVILDYVKAAIAAVK